MMIRRILLSVVFAGVLLGNTASAHHNMTALFDFNDRVTLTGTLSKVDWRNPHTYLTVDVKNAAGAMETWQSEDQIMVKALNLELRRARDKSLSGLIRTITLPNGRVVSACPQNC